VEENICQKLADQDSSRRSGLNCPSLAFTVVSFPFKEHQGERKKKSDRDQDPKTGRE
jgi:hypothetical protein